jgi:hypothetical protein
VAAAAEKVNKMAAVLMVYLEGLEEVGVPLIYLDTLQVDQEIHRQLHQVKATVEAMVETETAILLT